MIKLHGLCVSYGREQVLHACSMHIEPGSRVALMGPSGCGKTTLLHVTAGLLQPQKGTVSVNGSVSCLFQEPSLFPWLTAVENINVVLSDTTKTVSEAEAWLCAAGLSDCRDKYPHQLSGGQKQRVAICRALAYGGDILLLDEPLKGLDDETKSVVAELILHATAGKTVLTASHDMDEIRLLCDQVYTWQNGCFVQKLE